MIIYTKRKEKKTTTSTESLDTRPMHTKQFPIVAAKLISKWNRFCLKFQMILLQQIKKKIKRTIAN